MINSDFASFANTEQRKSSGLLAIYERQGKAHNGVHRSFTIPHQSLWKK
jgi:hypothetical protein